MFIKDICYQILIWKNDKYNKKNINFFIKGKAMLFIKKDINKISQKLNYVLSILLTNLNHKI
jgi:hypothetical protein